MPTRTQRKRTQDWRAGSAMIVDRSRRYGNPWRVENSVVIAPDGTARELGTPAAAREHASTRYRAWLCRCAHARQQRRRRTRPPVLRAWTAPRCPAFWHRCPRRDIPHADVRGLLTALGVERADVVGHSLGGAVAYLLAQRHPGVVRRLVLEDVPAPLPLDPPRVPAPRPDGELPFDWAMVRATDDLRNRPDPVWWERMSAVAVPTLVVAGGATSLVAQDQVAALARRIPGARLVTVGWGHLVHESRPEPFLRVVREFLAE